MIIFLNVLIAAVDDPIIHGIVKTPIVRAAKHFLKERLMLKKNVSMDENIVLETLAIYSGKKFSEILKMALRMLKFVLMMEEQGYVLTLCKGSEKILLRV